jgi:hypothetical protein
LGRSYYPQVEAVRLSRILRRALSRQAIPSSREIQQIGICPSSPRFERAIAPAVLVAIDELRRSAGECFEPVVEYSARRNLAQQLVTFLLKVLGPTLKVRERAAIYVRRAFGTQSDVNDDSLNELDLLDIVTTLPGSGETVALVIADWITSQRKMLGRLRRDWAQISRTLLSEPTQLRLIRIESGLSDSHDRGQTVAILVFKGGEKIVYKPRSCWGEASWFRALCWMETQGFETTFYRPKIMQRQCYGWMSFVPNKACRSRDSIKVFYFRWGAQAALAQILGASDLHRQNWIACGAHPTLIDAELLIHLVPGVSLSSRHRRQIHPLLRTGLLPLTPADGVGYYQGIAPFEHIEATCDETRFLPRYRANWQLPCDHSLQIVAGFRAAAEMLCSSRGSRFLRRLIAKHRPLRTRVLLRPTGEYYALLHESLQTRYMLRSGSRRDYLIARCAASQRETSIATQETDALFRCSVPRFTGMTVPCENVWVIPSIEETLSGMDILRARLKHRRQPRHLPADRIATKK